VIVVELLSGLVGLLMIAYLVRALVDPGAF